MRISQKKKKDRIDEIKKGFNLRDAFLTLISNGTNLYFVFFYFQVKNIEQMSYNPSMKQK
jgi:hypothetical protein